MNELLLQSQSMINDNQCPTNCTIADHYHSTPRAKDDNDHAIVRCDASTPHDELFATLEHVLACDGIARVCVRLPTAAALEEISAKLRARFGVDDASCIWFEELAGGVSGDALIVIDYTDLAFVDESSTEKD